MYGEMCGLQGITQNDPTVLIVNIDGDSVTENRTWSVHHELPVNASFFLAVLGTRVLRSKFGGMDKIVQQQDKTCVRRCKQIH